MFPDIDDFLNLNITIKPVIIKCRPRSVSDFYPYTHLCPCYTNSVTKPTISGKNIFLPYSYMGPQYSKK